MGCGMNKTKKPVIISITSLNYRKTIRTTRTNSRKKSYKNMISKNSWFYILDFLSYNEIKEVGKTNKMFNYLVKQNQILVKFFKNKNTPATSQNVYETESSNSKFKENFKFYESFALLQMDHLCESINSNCSSSSKRFII